MARGGNTRSGNDGMADGQRGCSSEAERLRILFRRSTSLPQLPRTAIRLVEAIDSDDVSATLLESIISTDPALATKIMRVSNSALFGHESSVCTIRGAILRIGLRTVRSIGVSLSVAQIANVEPETDLFDVERFARHSVFVGLMSRYLFARMQKLAEFESDWSADEVLAAGVLHDLSAALLASRAPDVYERTFNYARRSRSSISDAFMRIYGVTLGELTGEASEAWNLPPIFSSTLRFIDEPWSSPAEFEAISCIHYANYIADSNHFALGDWASEAPLAPEIADILVLDPKELELVLGTLGEQVNHMLEDLNVIPA